VKIVLRGWECVGFSISSFTRYYVQSAFDRVQVAVTAYGK